MKTTSRLESSLRDACTAWLKTLPYTWHFKVLGSAIQQAGVPDFLICHNGRFIAIELKKEDGSGTVSRIQNATIQRIVHAGGVAGVVESLDDFKRMVLWGAV